MPDCCAQLAVQCVIGKAALQTQTNTLQSMQDSMVKHELPNTYARETGLRKG